MNDVKPVMARRYLDYIESEGGACLLHIIAEDPNIYAGIDSEKIARASKARSTATAGPSPSRSPISPMSSCANA